jgi:hypothetical protein
MIATILFVDRDVVVRLHERVDRVLVMAVAQRSRGSE